MIVKKAAMMIEAHESVQKLNRLYFAYVHQSVSVTTVTAGQYNPAILMLCSSSETLDRNTTRCTATVSSLPSCVRVPHLIYSTSLSISL